MIFPQGVVNALLRAGANVNAVDLCGRSPLWFAAAEDQEEAAQLLIDAGADPAATDNQGTGVQCRLCLPLFARARACVCVCVRVCVYESVGRGFYCGESPKATDLKFRNCLFTVVQASQSLRWRRRARPTTC